MYSTMVERRRRVAVVVAVALIVIFGFLFEATKSYLENHNQQNSFTQIESNLPQAESQLAEVVLATLEVKGRAPKTGYDRSQFGDGWPSAGVCDVRNFILNRDLTDVITFSDEDCTVLEGKLNDPYSGRELIFERGPETSDDVQIDHVVALSDAWQKGAQQLDFQKRLQFANDSLNLLAVDGNLNQKKGDSDAASWLPPNKNYRCQYIARQVAVKKKYQLWVTKAEKSAMQRVLNNCKNQKLPIVS